MDEIRRVADDGTLSSGGAQGSAPGPLCLALETAARSASVALMRGAEVLDVRRGPEGQHHSETLLPMTDAVLAAAGCALEDIEVFAVSIGPGGFTGLRIGLATAKGLAFGSDQPAVAVSSLAALALAACRADPGPEGGIFVPALDALRGEVYAGGYAREALCGDLSRVQPCLAESLYTADDLARALPQGGRLVGEGAGVVAPGLAPGEASRWQAESGTPSVPDAVSVGLLGVAGLVAGRARPVAELVPRYVRRAEAEVMRTAERLEADPEDGSGLLTWS